MCKITKEEARKCKWCGEEATGLYKAEISKDGTVKKGWKRPNECLNCMCLLRKIQSNFVTAQKMINEICKNR